MTTLVQARDAMVTLVETVLGGAYPAMPRFYENTLSLDLDTVSMPFVKVEIDVDEAKFVTINDTPVHGVYGEVLVTVFYREGEGVRNTLAIFDTLMVAFKNQQTGGVTTAMPTPGRKQAQSGIVSWQLRIPFHYYSIS